MAKEWEVPKRSNACTACGRPFVDGEALAAYLQADGESYARRDQCLACDPPSDPPPLGTWRTRAALPSATGPVFDREGLFALLAGLGAASDPQPQRLRFVLALLLWRRKTLKLEDTRNDPDGELWIFRSTRSDDRYEIRRPDLDEGQAEQLSAQLEQLLAGGVDIGPAPTPSDHTNA